MSPQFLNVTILFFMIILMIPINMPITIAGQRQVHGLSLTITQAQSMQPPTIKSLLDLFRNNITSISLNASGSAVFNFTFNEANSSWTRTDVYIEGPLGGLENGGSQITDASSLTRGVRFFASETPGITWLRVSGITKDGSKSNQYVPIRIMPYNRSQEAAYFVVSSISEPDQERASNNSFIITVHDPRLISRARSIIQNNESKLITGIVAIGWGGYNVDLDNNRTWSWHLVPDTINFTDMSIELCDATPMHVEQHLFEWINEIGRYCPWNWKLEREIDYQVISELIDSDQQDPILASNKITEKDDVTTISIETLDDVGVINVTMTLQFNDGNSIVVPAQPNGNGTFKLRIPSFDAQGLTKITVAITDVKNHSTVEIIPLASKSPTISGISIIPSFTLKTVIVIALIYFAMKMRKRSKKHHVIQQNFQQK